MCFVTLWAYSFWFGAFPREVSVAEAILTYAVSIDDVPLIFLTGKLHGLEFCCRVVMHSIEVETVSALHVHVLT